VVITGGGIGGLTAALSLHDAGAERVQVLEVAPELRPLGAGVNLLPNAVRELAALGLYHEVAAVAVPTTELRYHNQHGDLILCESRSRGTDYDWPQLSIHRGVLQMLLAEAVRTRLGDRCLQLGSQVVGFAERPGSGVHVDLVRDGRRTSEEADVLVGADGIRSTVRRVLHREIGEPVWNGMVVWRGTTWAWLADQGNSMIIAGDGICKIVFYAISPPRADGKVLLNWAASRRLDDVEVDRSDWHRRVPAEKFSGEFEGWRVGDILITDLFTGADACFEYPMLDREPLAGWTRGPVTLLGDAAHAMQPMGSNATTQAIIDARALGYFLATTPDPERALADYERHRLPVTTKVQLANRSMGPEAVIDMVTALAPDGFTSVEDVVPGPALRAVSTGYAELAEFDAGSVNIRSPYDVRRARLLGPPRG
jgi:2-polyprenyl-6-methoxyphenol hydroxylase-like FAD-dependent oxidoreductase